MNLSHVIKISVLSSCIAFSTSLYAASDNSSEMKQTKAKNTRTSHKTTEAKNVNTQTSDSSITEYIKTNIKNSKMLSTTKVNVTTADGIVTLSGTVDSDSEASAIVELAESVVGVKSVRTTELTVTEGKQPFADMMITAKVKGFLIREDLFGDKDVASVNTSVETKDGVVYLTGIMDNKEQINNAVKIIEKNFPEVRRVEYRVNKFVTENEQKQ